MLHNLISRIGLGLYAWLVILYLLFPLAVLIAASFTATDFLAFPPKGLSLRWYARLIENAGFVEAAWTSVKLAAVATALAIVLGVPTALVLARQRFPGKAAINTIFISPLLLPAIVIGVAVLQYAHMLGFARTFWALLVGHVVIMVPYVIRTTMASLGGLPMNIEEAAQDLGANRIETFFLITLPQIKPGVIAGSLFAFIMSWINVEVSIFNSTAELVPIPVKLFNYIQYNIDPLVAAISAVTVYAAFGAVFLIDALIGIDKATNG
ncbi:Inner membrane ABC transporter permease protein YdcV (plasmid) [Roseovarius sp. THAF8]|uniref:ABC transporter permease n=1 Tax=Roseovarius sp. THAF8 TaxID=2587846 RepID=UPI0012A852BC|nr:ABC transporter permease [Roseovarius sp. THAF8]QFT99915.1 Inner membrane ABC transporter permease protein YdcV [Roseovarius sp. THAF8]